MCMHKLTYTHIFSLLCQLRAPRSNNTPAVIFTPLPRSWFFISFSNKRNHAPNSRTEQDLQRINLEPPVERKEMLKKQCKTYTHTQ